MKTTFKLLALVILVTFSSCNNSKKIEYKYAENPKLLACDYPYGDLLKEAVYSFENDLINTYNKERKNLSLSYSNYFNVIIRGNMKMKDLASEHSLKIAKALKDEKDLWTTKNGATSLNYSHPLVDCIANNIKDKDIKATYNALLSTNSLKTKTILPLLASNSRLILTDGSLKTYAALDIFYSQLLDVKLEELINPNPKPYIRPVDSTSNKKQTNEKQTPIFSDKEAKDPHAGHNHD